MKPGEYLALFNYYKVKSCEMDKIAVEDSAGREITISNGIVDSSMVSTSQFTKEEKVSRTRMSQLIECAGHAPFRVTFQKKVEANDIADGIVAASETDFKNQAQTRKLVRSLYEGEKRVMHAKLQRSGEDDVQMELGRYKVIDLEANGPRLVDTRSVSELVIEGTRYYV